MVNSEKPILIRKSCHSMGKRYLVMLLAFSSLAQVTACFNTRSADSELVMSSDSAPTGGDFPFPIYPDRVDFAVGHTASQQLRELASGEPAAILLAGDDCSFCLELRSSLAPVLEASKLLFIAPDKEIASTLQSGNTVSLQFIDADGTIVGREMIPETGSFDSSRVSWLANATQSIDSGSVTALTFIDEPQNKFVAVTNQAVSLYSTEDGALLQTIASGETFEGAWTLGEDLYGVSECCEPATGRLWLVDAGKHLDRTGAAWNAISARRSPDNKWILTSSSSTSIWPSENPFTSDPIDVLPPGSPPMSVEWLRDSLGVAALWVESAVRQQAAIEVIKLSDKLQIASRQVIAVPPETVGIAPLNDDTLILAINGEKPSLVRLDLNIGISEQLITLRDKIKAISLSHSGQKLLTLTERGQVTILSTADWNEILTVQGPFKSANW